MTVQQTQSQVIRDGDGVNRVFDFAFQMAPSSMVEVTEVLPSGEFHVVPTTDYTVVLSEVGGTVTFNDAPETGKKIAITRMTDVTQLVSVSEQTAYDPRVVESVWDKLTLLIQELDKELETVLKGAPGSDPEEIYNRFESIVDEAADQANLARAWAESSGEPGGPGTKSSKSWAGVAEDWADEVEDIILTANPVDFATKAVVETTNIPIRLEHLRTAGYDEPDDLGGGLYTRSDGTSRPGDIISADGARWRLVPGKDGLNVKAFGAKGDSTADDTAAIKAAVSTNNRIIFFPPGRYRITETIAMDGHGQWLVGAGPNSSIIYVEGNGGISVDRTRQGLEKIAIHCGTHGGNPQFGLRLTETYFTARDVIINWEGVGKFENAVIIPQSASPWVSHWENCMFATTVDHAFFVQGNAFNHARFVGCTFRGAGSNGLYMSGVGHGVSFHGCRAENNANHGFSFAGRRGLQASFHGVYLEHNGGAGIFAGSTSPGWSTVDDYMEPLAISGLTSWENGLAAVDVYKCRSVHITGATIGATAAGYYSNGAIQAGWTPPPFPWTDPQVIVEGLSRRGDATDYNLISSSPRIMVVSGEGASNDQTDAQGWAPSSLISRTARSLSGAYASRNITLGTRTGNPAVSAFASFDAELGSSNAGAVIASTELDLTGASSGSYCNAIIASEISSWSKSSNNFNSTILSSRRVESASSQAVCGGYAASGGALSANRKWEIESRTGDISISGALTSSHVFADFAEMLPNATGAEIPPGTILTLDTDGVRPAQDGEWIAGVVSHTAALLAGDTPFCWQGRYLYDEWGRPIMEEIPDPDHKGDGPTPMIRVQAENPDWNPELPQVPRSERPADYTPVGMVGQVRVRVAEGVQPGDRISADNGIGVLSTVETGLRVMRLIAPTVALCVVNIRV